MRSRVFAPGRQATGRGKIEAKNRGWRAQGARGRPKEVLNSIDRGRAAVSDDAACCRCCSTTANRWARNLLVSSALYAASAGQLGRGWRLDPGSGARARLEWS